MVAVPMVLALLIAGCPADDPTCVPDCSERCCGDDGCGGICQDQCTGDQPACEPKTCTCGACLQMGFDCIQGKDCCDGFCIKYTGEQYGYCSTHDCQNNWDCVNEAGDEEMCCVDVGGEYFICMKIVAGYGCGGGPYCGWACLDDTDCPPYFSCIRDNENGAFCTHQCNSYYDCTDCENPYLENNDFSCQTVSAEFNFCLPAQDLPCDSSSDCEHPEVCTPWPTDDEQDIEGRCRHIGNVPPGGPCDSHEEDGRIVCAGYYCINDHCSEVCAQQSDCRDQEICAIRTWELDEQGDIIAQIGMCFWYAGSLNPCTVDADCTPAELCQTFDTPEGSELSVCLLP